MIHSSLRAILLAALAAVATPLGAQVETGQPIRVRVDMAKPPTAKFKGEVLNATITQITVRSREDQRTIRTFHLSPKVSEQMQRTIDRGGYQYGDRVEIEFEAGSDVAIKLKGRPSRPL